MDGWMRSNRALLFDISLSRAGYGSISPTYVNYMGFKEETEEESNKGMFREEWCCHRGN